MRIRIEVNRKMRASAFFIARVVYWLETEGPGGRIYASLIMTTLRLKIRRIRNELGLSQAEFAALLDVAQGSVSKWERRIAPERPTITNLKKIANLGKTTLDELAGIDERLATITVVAEIGAGEVLLEISDEDYAFIVAPPGVSPTSVAAIVRPNGLGPVFCGWHIFYEPTRDPPTDELLGKLCVVGLESGKQMVKVLRPGQLQGRYNLESLVGPPIYDASVAWASLITHMAQT